MADAVEALGQHMQEEPAHELARLERHGLVAARPRDPVVLERERHTGRVGFDQPAVGDRHPVRIASEVGKHGFRSGERALGVDVPLDVVERAEERLEGGRVGKMRVLVEELQLAGSVHRLQQRQHLGPEQALEHRHRQQEVLAAADPLAAVSRDATARHDHVHVRMVGHGGTPRVQHRGEADLDAEPLRVGCDRQQRLGRGPEQQIVDHRLVLEGDGPDPRRQREHHVEIGHLQQLGLPRLQPLAGLAALTLRAVPVAATAVSDRRVPARRVLTTRNVATEGCRAAALDRAHHLQLGMTEAALVGMTPSRTVVAEDARDHQCRTGHVRR